MEIDAVSCVRCGEIAVAAFVFDDGSFWCKNCLDYMLKIPEVKEMLNGSRNAEK